MALPAGAGSMPRVPSAFLWCPAYPLADAAHLARTLAAAQALATRCGWSLTASPLLGRHPGPGAWLPAAERCADLQAGLGHDVLLAARGGYGCLDLLDGLAAYRRPLPLLVGYSDLTVLHAWWFRQGAAAIHGCMPGVAHGELAASSTAALAGGQPLQLAGDAGAIAPGRARGRLFPACLRVLAGLVGTPAMPDLAGAILALEDVDERPYRVERDLQQLWRAGVLTGVRALLLGRFPADLPADYQGPTLTDLAQAWADRLGVPVVAGLNFGHEADPQALPVGAVAELVVDARGWRLTVPTPRPPAP